MSCYQLISQTRDFRAGIRPKSWVAHGISGTRRRAFANNFSCASRIILLVESPLLCFIYKISRNSMNTLIRCPFDIFIFRDTMFFYITLLLARSNLLFFSLSKSYSPNIRCFNPRRVHCVDSWWIE